MPRCFCVVDGPQKWGLNRTACPATSATSFTAEVSNPPGVCVGCGSGRLIGHGRIKQVIRDMPTHGKRVAIYVDTRRWCCADCGKTIMEALPAVNAMRDMTERLCQWIGQQSLKRTFASIADNTGLDEKTIRNIFRDYVSYSFEALRAKILFTEGAHKKTLARPKFQRKRDPVVMDLAADDTMGYGVPGQAMEGPARTVVGTPGKKAETHETGEPAKNYGADITALTQLIESGRL